MVTPQTLFAGQESAPPSLSGLAGGYIKRGDDALSNKDYDKARQYYQLALNPGFHATQDQIDYATKKKQEAENLQREANLTPAEKSLDAGKDAYRKGNLAQAKTSLLQVQSGTDQYEDAQQYLFKINLYEKAQGLEAQSPKVAIDIYDQLIADPSFPLNAQVKARIGELQTTAAKAAVPARSVSVVKDPKALLAEAHALQDKGDLTKAKAVFQEALGIDAKNAEALAGLKAIDDALRANADLQLKEGIKEFLTCDYRGAEDSLKQYLDSGAGHAGAAHFFLGAAETAETLQGQTDQRLRTDAGKQFSQAKSLGYRPVPGSVSPRILNVWKGSV
uniref:Tetratricopeptide repeat protein n=2 Tax=Paracidobacterium acidisoli TaxID=2303751 RepID=A0A372IR13_9BACT